MQCIAFVGHSAVAKNPVRTVNGRPMGQPSYSLRGMRQSPRMRRLSTQSMRSRPPRYLNAPASAKSAADSRCTSPTSRTSSTQVAASGLRKVLLAQWLSFRPTWWPMPPTPPDSRLRRRRASSARRPLSRQAWRAMRPSSGSARTVMPKAAFRTGRAPYGTCEAGRRRKAEGGMD